jgi:hypothetical protein
MHIKIVTQRLYKAILLFTALLMSACQSLPQIHALYDETAELAHYSTFAFHPRLQVKGDEYDKLSTRYIKAAIRQQMENQGYRYSANSELWVNFNTSTKEKLSVIRAPEPYPYYYFRYDYAVWGGYPHHEPRIDQYTEGTLNIDVIDRESNKLLWEGIAIGKLNKKTMDNLEAKIDEAVGLIFEKFP